MKQFDRTKPHGTVMGAQDGRHFVQDEQYYRADGSPWETPATTQGDTGNSADLPTAAVSGPDTGSPEFQAAVAAAVAEELAKRGASAGAGDATVDSSDPVADQTAKAQAPKGTKAPKDGDKDLNRNMAG